MADTGREKQVGRANDRVEQMGAVVITGSTRGIGLGIAGALLTRDCDVVVSGRTQASVDRALDHLGPAAAARVVGRACDVTDAGQVQALWDGAIGRFGRVDIWINNAGVITRNAPLWEQDPADLSAVVATNLTGTLHGCRVAIRGMLAQGGGHVYLMEGLGSGGEVRPGTTPYGMTKYGVAVPREGAGARDEADPRERQRDQPGHGPYRPVAGQRDARPVRSDQADLRHPRRRRRHRRDGPAATDAERRTSASILTTSPWRCAR